MKRKKAENMLFFKKKKEEKPPEIPKYNVFIETKENKIELKIDFSFELKNTKFTEICYEIMDALMDEYSVFAISSNLEEYEIKKYIEAAETNNIEFLLDNEKTIIERQKGVHSLLLKKIFINRTAGDNSMPQRNFELNGFCEDVQIKKSIDEQQLFFNENESDIHVSYEDNFSECQTLIISIKRNLYEPKYLIKLLIDTCKKYGKNIELIYKDETIID